MAFNLHTLLTETYELEKAINNNAFFRIIKYLTENPDISFSDDIFQPLVSNLKEDKSTSNPRFLDFFKFFSLCIVKHQDLKSLIIPDDISKNFPNEKKFPLSSYLSQIKILLQAPSEPQFKSPEIFIKKILTFKPFLETFKPGKDDKSLTNSLIEAGKFLSNVAVSTVYGFGKKSYDSGLSSKIEDFITHLDAPTEEIENYVKANTTKWKLNYFVSQVCQDIYGQDLQNLFTVLQDSFEFFDEDEFTTVIYNFILNSSNHYVIGTALEIFLIGKIVQDDAVLKNSILPIEEWSNLLFKYANDNQRDFLSFKKPDVNSPFFQHYRGIIHSIQMVSYYFYSFIASESIKYEARKALNKQLDISEDLKKTEDLLHKFESGIEKFLSLNLFLEYKNGEELLYSPMVFNALLPAWEENWLSLEKLKKLYELNKKFSSIQ